MTYGEVSIKFEIGSRTLFKVRRKLLSVNYSLEQLLDSDVPEVPNFGYNDARILSLPQSCLPRISERFPNHIVGGVNLYDRMYLPMEGSFSDYLSQFSSKTRSTFKRKARKIAEISGGELEVCSFRLPSEVDAFFDEALPLSRRTYQARFLDAGLPEGPAARDEARALAAADRLRAFILRVNGRAIAYLYLPIDGETLIYAFLGYDPEFASMSPGTVLQLRALELLFEERRFRYFDFTTGEGEHKRMFGTAKVAACSFLLLRSSVQNWCLLRALGLFNAAVKTAKRWMEGSSKLSMMRKLLRS